jgi:hypothetical protein
MKTLRVLGVPAELYERNLKHLEEITHEFQLMEIGESTADEPAPARLVRLMNGIIDTYADVRDDSREQARRAIEAGQEHVDLVVTLPPEASTAAADVLSLLEEADELCRQGGMLALPADEDVARLRRWLNDEIAAQLRGADPRPWPQSA